MSVPNLSGLKKVLDYQFPDISGTPSNKANSDSWDKKRNEKNNHGFILAQTVFKPCLHTDKDAFFLSLLYSTSPLLGFSHFMHKQNISSGGGKFFIID